MNVKTINIYRLAFPATRKEVESEYPAMSTKAKKLLTALRVKRQRREDYNAKRNPS